MQEFQEMLYALPLDHPASHDSFVGVLSMGNPHAVQVVADLESAPVLEEGPVLSEYTSVLIPILLEGIAKDPNKLAVLGPPEISDHWVR
jgi:hypothetical protein